MVLQTPWFFLGRLDPKWLIEARLQLHYAIQLIAAAGDALIPPAPDFSHSSLSWEVINDTPMFVGAVIPADQPFQVALEPSMMTLSLLDAQRGPVAALSLPGKTLQEGFGWLRQEIALRGAAADTVVFLDYPDDFPKQHPIAAGATFATGMDTSLQELAYYYADTHYLLQQIRREIPAASPIHIWPHHFDMACLIELPGQKNGEAISIGVGLSPGDGSYSEPYWYISPWPYPDPSQLPALAVGGFWHTQHWVGAILTGTQASAFGSEQAEQTLAFIRSAIQACQKVLLS
jgi:hypothetical protein